MSVLPRTLRTLFKLSKHSVHSEHSKHFKRVKHFEYVGHFCKLKEIDLNTLQCVGRLTNQTDRISQTTGTARTIGTLE